MAGAEPLRVCIVPEYPVSLMTGGLQVQALETWRAINALKGGVTAELFNWSEARSLPDLYHLVGLPPYLARVAELIHDARRPYVLTLLFGSSLSRLGLALKGVRLRVKARLWPGRSPLRVIEQAAGLVTITEADAEAAAVMFGLDPVRVEVVRNGVQEEFFDASPAVWQQRFGQAPFILCVGAVQARKNQLLLLQVANQLRLPVVLLGPVLPGQEAYAEQVAMAARENQACGGRWLRDLGHEDPLLFSAFGACRMFALFSVSETQPLSVMQAMAAGKPVLLLRAAYTSQALLAGLPAASADPRDLRESLARQWEQGTPTSLPPDYSWLEVARRLCGIYQRCAGAGTAGRK